MAKEIEAARLAMSAVSEARRDERRQRLQALYTAAVALNALTRRYHDWLVTEDQWLSDNQTTSYDGEIGQAFLARETRYLARVMAYQEAMDVLSAAYEMVRDASRSPSMPAPKQSVWRQLGEAPF
jgi:hypothetical protein